MPDCGYSLTWAALPPHPRVVLPGSRRAPAVARPRAMASVVAIWRLVVRTVGARQRSTPRLTFRRRLAAGAALCIATTTAAVVAASVPALATVSAVTVTPARSAAGALTIYTINFTTTVALAADVDTVTLIGTADTV